MFFFEAKCGRPAARRRETVARYSRHGERKSVKNLLCARAHTQRSLFLTSHNAPNWQHFVFAAARNYVSGNEGVKIC